MSVLALKLEGYVRGLYVKRTMLMGSVRGCVCAYMPARMREREREKCCQLAVLICFNFHPI